MNDVVTAGLVVSACWLAIYFGVSLADWWNRRAR